MPATPGRPPPDERQYGAVMPKTAVKNDTESTLCLWLEPWGSDHWMRPGDRFTIVAEGDPDEPCFETVIHDQGISIWVNAGSEPKVIDNDGKEIPCGYQRPIETLRAWLAASERAVQASADKSPKVQELSRRHYEQLRLTLAHAEAAQHAK